MEGASCHLLFRRSSPKSGWGAATRSSPDRASCDASTVVGRSRYNGTHMKDITIASPFLVPTDGSFKRKHTRTTPPKKAPSDAACERKLRAHVDQIAKLQRKLHATDTWAMLLVFQALDAAGKDGTIRAVMSGVDPSGCEVFSFKQPTHEDLDHDFLWRTERCLPERGRIGIFNRSYYEEVLVVRVHPELVDGQRLPQRPHKLAKLWTQRYESIVDHEKHLARNGVAIVKFWLNVSKREQKKRFLERIDDESHNWKFSESDVAERERWDDYMDAYEDALRETSKPWAPWYAIPADGKPFMRMAVARIVESTLEQLDLRYPDLPGPLRKRLVAMRRRLLAE
jgi:PPK2 family polyphosphate:nucleotide phosphotransferase